MDFKLGSQIGEFAGGKIYSNGLQHGSVSVSADLFGVSFGIDYSTVDGKFSRSFSKTVNSDSFSFTIDNSGNIKIGKEAKFFEGGVVKYADGTTGIFAGIGLQNKLSKIGLSVDGTIPVSKSNLSLYNSTTVYNTGKVYRVEFVETTNQLKKPYVEANYTIYENGKIVAQDSTYVDRETAASMGAGLPLKQCFSKNTSILLSSCQKKNIGDVKIGEEVTSFDLQGQLKFGVVCRLFRNTTDEWLLLQPKDSTLAGSVERYLLSTPGHHFLDSVGSFRTISEILSQDGGNGIVTDIHGKHVEILGTILRSDDHRNIDELFNATEVTSVTEFLKRQGFGTADFWNTYNFEVEEYHTYVAGGVRVHNLSELASAVDSAFFDATGPQARLGVFGDAYHTAMDAIDSAAKNLPAGIVRGSFVGVAGALTSAAFGLVGAGISVADGFKNAATEISKGNLLGALGSFGKGLIGAADAFLGGAVGILGSVVEGAAKLFSGTFTGIFNGMSGGGGGSSAGARMEAAGRATASVAGSTRTDVARSVFGAAREAGFDTNSAAGFTRAALAESSSSRSKGGSGKSKPVLIDLSGKGVTVDTLQTSQNFFDFDGDGYQRRTAWAGSGTGVLVFDADGDGKISRSSEFAFTEWAEGVDSDLEALRRVFDTNNNNKLDAGDSRWADFKIWLNGALVSLGSQNIASIDLISSGSGQTFDDGSAITGGAAFTRADGTTGTVADAVLASEEDSQVVKTGVVTNADGTKTTTIIGFDKDGSTAFRNVLTTSADGLNVRTQFDDNGDGIFDRSQTDVRSETNGVQKRIVRNFKTDGSLKDSITTTTSADLATVTTEVDQDGDGKRDQVQVYQKNTDGSTSTTVTQYSVSGAVLKRVMTTSSPDGLTKKTQTDADGNGYYERVHSETISTDTSGNRRTQIEERGGSGNVFDREVTITSADGLLTTVYNDHNGDGTYETRKTSLIQVDAAGVTKTTSSLLDNKLVLLGRTITTASKDGLSKIVQTDADGNNTIDFVRSDVTVVSAGAMTQTVSEKSGNGTVLNLNTTTTSADRKAITIEADLDGDGKLESQKIIAVNTAGVTTTTETQLAASGAVVAKVSTVSSADGLTVNTKTDRNGDGIIDDTVADVTVSSADGSRTRTVTTTSNDGTLIAKSQISTTADALTTTTSVDRDTNGSYDLVTADVITLNADGSRLETVTVSKGTGIGQSRVSVLISADRKTVTTSSDLNGDGKVDETKIAVEAADGSRTETTTRTSSTGTILAKTETTTSANGLAVVEKRDADGNGSYELTRTSSTVLGSTGGRTTTISIAPTAQPTTLVSKSVKTVTGNGLITTETTDANGDGVFETMVTEQTTLYADGSTTIAKTLADSTGKLLRNTTVTTSASELFMVSQEDLDGDATFESVTTNTTALAANGSKTATAEEKSSSGTLISRSVTVTQANGHDATVTSDLDGDGVSDEARSVVVNADGSTTSVVQTFDVGSQLVSKSTEVVSANGLQRTLAVDANGDGVTDRSTTDLTTLNTNGSRTRVFSEFGAGNVLIGRATSQTSANGLVKTTTWSDASGATKRSSSEATTLLNDGGTVLTVSFFKADGTLESKTVKNEGTRGTVTTVTRDNDGDGVDDAKTLETKSGSGGVTQVFTDYGAGSIVKDTKTVTVSPNGLSQTMDFDSDGNGSIDKRIVSATVLNADGSRTTTNTVSNAGVSGLVMATKAVTDTSVNGLSVTTKWDLNADGTFEKSQNAVTVLGADGSKTQTISNLTGATLISRYVTAVSGNGLSTTQKWDPTGSGTYAQTSTDIVTFGTVGESVRTVTAMKADGSILSKTIASTNGSGEIVTTVLEEAGQAGRTVTSTTDSLADGAVRQTVLTRLTATGALTEKTVTLTSADKRSVTIERDTNGDGIVDQREEQIKAVSGEEMTIVTTFGSGSLMKDKTTILRSADGRRTTTNFDRDGNGVIDRTKVTDEVVNVDGSRMVTTTDTDLWSGKPAAKLVTSVSADGVVTTTARDIDGDGTIDQTEVVTLDATGVATTVLTNATAAARNVTTLPSGAVQWKALVAETISTATSADRRSTVSTLAYADNNNGVVTRTTAVMRQTRQIDGSSVTDVTETNASGTLIARGQIVISTDGRMTVLTKDADGNGVTDVRQTAVTRLDNSVILTKTDLNPDGSTLKTVTETVSMLGSLINRVSSDANGRKTEDLTLAPDGSSVMTQYDAASGAILSVTKANKAGVLIANTLYDPLGNQPWVRVEQTFDAAGNKATENQFNDDGTRIWTVEDLTGGQSWSRYQQTFDTSSRLTTQTNIYRDGTKWLGIYDANGSQSWTRLEKSYDVNNQQTYENDIYDDGTRISVNLDPSNVQGWDTIYNYYDKNNQVLRYTVNYDDRGVTDQYFDLDGIQPWQNIIYRYNGSGALDYTYQLSDDGFRYKKTDTSNGTHRVDQYTFDERLMFSSSSFDGNYLGNYTQSYDYTNTNSWSSIIQYTNRPTTGASIWKIVYYDNGWRDEYDKGQRMVPKEGYYTWNYIKTYDNNGNLRSTVSAPIVLDLNDSNSIEVVPLTVDGEDGSSVDFHWSQGGATSLSAWVASTDAFLAIDLSSEGSNGPDGVINQGRELAFADWIEKVDGSEENYSDMDGLRLVFDTNHDNILSSLDDRWSEFRVWQDLNQNGLSEAGELKTMSEAGISLINLIPSTDGAQTFSDGSMITGTSSYQTTDGKQHLAADVALAWRPVVGN